ncbi:Methyltransferase type 11 [Oscillochloris trichoides DG-6]|uniref:Methyltransferase type 11 n=1 Tax=Oscillochloris trichoides DG-6 TaxID=765420 RepID=E1ICP3_9CHLR|nr:class I SAM-dependent methyltransferase [Oscillochloris trichoides]EFO81063.1 Methyltransferase type 11 [Oscillochloris trichoides DG-6]
MYPEALAYLRCPRHPAVPLVLEERRLTAADGAILRGGMRCAQCRRRYPITEGILDLLGPLALPATATQLTNALPLTAWGYERVWRPRALSLLAGQPLGYTYELPLIAGLAAPQRGGLFVDVACSNGLYARTLEQARAGAVGVTFGIDHSGPMLRQARAFALSEGLRINYVRATAQALPFAAQSVAGLTMGGSLNEIGAVDRALAEWRRTLAPDGRGVMMNLVQAERWVGRAVQGMLGYAGVSFWSLDDLNRRYVAAGLRLRAQWQYGVVVFSQLTAGATAPRLVPHS